MPWSGDHPEHSSAQIDLVTVVDPMRDGKRSRGVLGGIEPGWQVAANLAGSDFRLGVFF